MKIAKMVVSLLFPTASRAASGIISINQACNECIECSVCFFKILLKTDLQLLFLSQTTIKQDKVVKDGEGKTGLFTKNAKKRICGFQFSAQLCATSHTMEPKRVGVCRGAPFHDQRCYVKRRV
jgi:hypothetical protein